MSSRKGETRDKLVDAALKIADEEGYDALSMRRVAAAAGMGTMSVYHYFKNKDELVYWASERIGQEILLDEVPADWRQALRAIAYRSREMLLRRPWVMHVPTSEINALPPSFALHVEQSLQAVEPLRVDHRTAMTILRAVDGFTVGTTADDAEQLGNDAASEHFVGSMGEVGDELGLPRLQVAAKHGLEHQSAFEDGLEWLLDGIEARYGADVTGRADSEPA